MRRPRLGGIQKYGVAFRDARQSVLPPASTLEVLETVPDSVLRRLKQYSGRLATEAVHAMEERLPFFAELEASQRASVHLVVQTAVVNFVEWMRNPKSNVSYTAQAFEVVPQDLTAASRCGRPSRWCASRWSSSRRWCRCWPGPTSR